MSPLQLSLILHTLFSYLSLITTLPITSKPLDNTPEHLTWEAWLLVDSKNPSDQEKTRKITPKSIFITPNFNNVSQSQCPEGFKNDNKGQCIQIVSINQDEYYKMRLDSILGSTSHDDDVSYDYDNYDADQQAGPLQVNIPFNINFDPRPPEQFKGDFDDFDEGEDGETESEQPFLGDHHNGPFESSSTVAVEKTNEKTEKPDTTSTTSATLNVIPLSRVVTTTDRSTDEDIVLETTTISSSETSSATTAAQKSTTTTRSTTAHRINDQHQHPSTMSTTSTTITGTTSTSTTTTTTALPTITTTTIRSLFDDDNKKIVEIEKINQKDDEQFKIEMGDRLDANGMTGGGSSTVNVLGEVNDQKQDDESNLNEENENLKIDLQRESFLFDVNDTMETTTIPTDISSTEDSSSYETVTTNIISTTVMSEGGEFTDDAMKNDYMESAKQNIEEPATTPMTTESNDSIPQSSTIHKHFVLPESSTKTTSTSESVMIVTPEKIHNQNQNPPASITITSTTTQATKPHHSSEYTNLRIENETNSDKILRETLIKHEEKQSAIENIDTRNRFVYHHLGNIDSVSATTTPPPPLPMRHNPTFVENQIHNNHNNKNTITRIRFPSSSSSTGVHHHNSQRQGSVQSTHDRDVVRFPGPTSQRIGSPAAMVAQQTKNSLTTDNKKPFWWLPDGWHIDQTDRGSALLKLWQSRPVVSPQSTIATTSPTPSTLSTQQHWRSTSSTTGGGSYGRENSRLPTESLYREISSHDIYKVLTARNLNHNNR